MKQERYIWLDLGGVIFESSGKSNQQIDWSIIHALNHVYSHNLNIGLDTITAFLSDYNKQMGFNLKELEFLSSVFDTLTFNEELIQYLQGVGKIVVVSDNYRENIRFISDRYHFEQWAWRQFYSYTFGVEKTNPIFFKQLLSQFPDIDVGQILYIDDSPDKLLAASQFGIRGIHYINNEKCMAEIERILLLNPQQ